MNIPSVTSYVIAASYIMNKYRPKYLNKNKKEYLIPLKDSTLKKINYLI